MLQLLLSNKKLYYTLLFWVAVGVFTGPLVYVIVPAHLIMLRGKGEWLVILLGIWLMLTLSDSRQGMFRFSQSVKPILMGLLGVFYFMAPSNERNMKFVGPFIPFFLVAMFCWLDSPVQFDSFQKMASYAILLLVIPWIVNMLLNEDRDKFLYHLVMLGTVVLLIGVALRYLRPAMVIFAGERFSGLLGNPNGMGIYGFMFFCLVTIINTFHPRLFTIAEKVVVYFLIIISLVWAGSRGGIFSSLLFLAGWWLFRRNVLIGFAVMTAVYISYQLVMSNFVEIVTSLGLEDYFRLDTLESGSGRVVAREFAWTQIELNYWLGKGIGYTEHLMHLHAKDFLQKGHQGNVHNSYLTIWLDTGLIGLIAFCWGWLRNFVAASAGSPVVWAVLFGLLLSTTVESWLAASLNPFTIQLVIILSLLGNRRFFES